MPAIRVLVVGDSVVTPEDPHGCIVSTDPDIQVIGTASDGRIAIAKISQTNPDLITMDIEMPVMNGLEALALGASDYVTKPSNGGSPLAAIERVRSELIPKIKALCRSLVASRKPGPSFELPLARMAMPTLTRQRQELEALAIGMTCESCGPRLGLRNRLKIRG